MFRNLIKTDNSVSGMVLRLTLGIVFFPHGAQKLLGWFSGPGFGGAMQFFTQAMGFPWILGLLVIVAEFFGPLGLLVGLLSRVAAFGIACDMLVATLTVHLPHGFFMNWSGQQPGEGFEFHILAIGIALAVMIRGSGALSIDGKLSEALAGAHDGGKGQPVDNSLQ